MSCWLFHLFYALHFTPQAVAMQIIQQLLSLLVSLWFRQYYCVHFNFQSSAENEQLIRELREELVQANQLRKQQLVELGLLREEEKQKIHRDHEAEVRCLKSFYPWSIIIWIILCLILSLNCVKFKMYECGMNGGNFRQEPTWITYLGVRQ